MPHMVKEQPWHSPQEERNWLKPGLGCSSRILGAGGEGLVGCNERGLHGNAHQPSAQTGGGTGSVIDALASGREADNGCGILAVLCHQTRGLKDGALEYYQSFLDQDVMLSGSFSFSLSPPPQWRTLLFLPL